MLKNYFKIAFRNLLRFKVYTLINLVGLSMGLSVAVLILLFVTDEVGFDKFHNKGDRIFKIVTANGEGKGMETNAWPVANKLVNEYPEVEAVVYTRKAPASFKVNYEGKRYEHNAFYAGEEFFNIFTFPLMEGNSRTALKDPYSIVITNKVKEQYFGSALALGKTIMIQDTLEFTVTGVIENLPIQSHIQFDPHHLDASIKVSQSQLNSVIPSHPVYVLSKNGRTHGKQLILPKSQSMLMLNSGMLSLLNPSRH